VQIHTNNPCKNYFLKEKLSLSRSLTLAQLDQNTLKCINLKGGNSLASLRPPFLTNTHTK
jgi:hypothetical protein